MSAEEHYPESSQFNGFRFVDPEILCQQQQGSPSSFRTPQPTASRLTDVDNKFPMWGTGRMACPGRYYATAFMKVVLGFIILNYDFSLAKPDDTRWSTWRSAMIPKTETMVIFTPR